MNAKVSNVRRGPALQADSPTQEIIKAANTPREITDALGRKLMIKTPSALEKLRLIKAIGDLAKNEMYFGYATLAICVKSIDGTPVEPCSQERHIEALVAELGDEGIEAVGGALAADAGMSQEELVNSARNFTETPSSAK